jgi:hypothetical protein
VSRFAVVASIAAAVALGLSAATCSKPPEPPAPQSTFDSPSQAGAALFEAVQKDDAAALQAIFGPDGKDLVSSGDAAADHDLRQRFIDRYRKMHRIGLDADSRTALIIGAENWPFPISLTQDAGKWRFDTAAGKAEILYRRIGRNERGAIDTCEALAAAQKEYFGRPHDGQPARQYAQHMVSHDGRHDGLFWTSDGREESHVGSLLAFADAEATAKEAGQGRMPFHGYFFKLIKSGDGRSFIVDGKLTNFAFLAYPAEYRSSGVMTLVVGSDGIVYQRDLGADTLSVAGSMSSVLLDGSWSRARD